MEHINYRYIYLKNKNPSCVRMPARVVPLFHRCKWLIFNLKTGSILGTIGTKLLFHSQEKPRSIRLLE